jgi:regulator of sirC expression with transglutaminase-like and TPR domain
VRAPGTYKIQVEHATAAALGTKVSYTISIGDDTRTREFDLVANRPFVPLVADVPHPQKVKVVVSGLPDSALKQTRVYTYNADYIPYWEYFDSAKDNGLHDVELIRKLLAQPEDKIDLARFKLTIDKLVSPRVDVAKALKEIDAMVRRVKAMPEFGTTATSKAIALQRFIYTAGPWNGYRPFEYDLDDPLGETPTNKVLPTYLSTRKGNCVTMPFLFIILGQRLGIDVTASSAPNHILVKFRNELGIWLNLEATRGANPARELWIRQQSPSITDKAMESGIYLRPLSKKETAALMAGLLSEYYFKQQQYPQLFALADVLLEHYSKDVLMMVRKGAAYGRTANRYLTDRLSSSGQRPSMPRWYYDHLVESNQLWFAKAEALGWREETRQEKQRYLEGIQITKQEKSRN